MTETNTTVTTQEHANKEISRLIKQAESLINKATALADEWDVEFWFNAGGDGMGGYYTPQTKDENCDWKYSSGGWQSSSSNC